MKSFLSKKPGAFLNGTYIVKTKEKPEIKIQKSPNKTLYQQKEKKIEAPRN